MAKVFFRLPGYYEGIRARRIKQSGRLWLVRVVSDPDKREGGTFRPYWFVVIKHFDLAKDKVSGATSIGVWRFGHEDEAFAKFAELEPLYPPFPARLPSPAQIAHRNKIRLHGIPKIHKEFPSIPLSRASGSESPPQAGLSADAEQEEINT